MSTIRDWLQLFRSHTSPLEATIITMGAVLGYGEFFRWEVFFWVLGGWLYHNTGYGQNSVEDFARGFDRSDPNKSHHPLQRGAISIARARVVVYSLMGISVVYAVNLSRYRRPALFLLFVTLAGGQIYNIWGKRMALKAVPIAIAHSLLFPFAFFSTVEISHLPEATSFGVFSHLFNDKLGWTAIVATVYLLAQVLYQIMIEGDLKDLGMDEEGVLDRFGVDIEGGHFTISTRGTLLSLFLKVLNIACACAVALLLDSPPAVYAVLAVFACAIMYMERRLMGPRKWDHHVTTTDMAVMEILTVYMLIVALEVPFGWRGVLTLMAGGIAYFVVMNRFLWNTVIRPAV